MHIILDTNILRSDFLLKSKHFKSLIDYSRKTGSVIVLPQLVLEELSALYEKNIRDCHKNAHSAFENLNSLLKEPIATLTHNLSYETLCKEYIWYVERKLSVHWLSKPDYKDYYLKQLVYKSINRIKPFSDKGEGFRDGIIWLTIVDYIKLHGSYEEYTFISNNTRDFSDYSGNGLHYDLLSDIKPFNSKFNYYKSLSEFLKKHASNIDFISEDWIRQNLDWEYINSQATKMVDSIHYVYYESYYFKTISAEKENFSYEVIDAYINRELSDFYIVETDIQTFIVRSPISGICKVDFFSDTGESHVRELTFNLEFQFIVKEQRIISYQKEFYEEEIGFLNVF